MRYARQQQTLPRIGQPSSPQFPTSGTVGTPLWTPEAVASALQSDLQGTRATLAMLTWAADQLRVHTRATMIGLLATARVEVGPKMTPVREGYWLDDDTMYTWAEIHYGYHTDIGQQLENTEPGDGFNYRGGGIIQRTGRGGYRDASKRLAQAFGLSVDLEAMPDVIVDPYISAAVAVIFLYDRDLHHWCEQGLTGDDDAWKYVRYRVNGGYNGLEDFMGYVHALSSLPVLT